jgi:flagellar L-ring protein precursor FlgH
MKIFIMFLMFSGCSNYVQRMHQEIDRGKGQRALNVDQREKFNMYRNNEKGEFRSLDYRNQVEPSVSTSAKKNLNPAVKRFYQSSKRRYNAEDLVDNEDSGSLWATNGQESFLFSKNNYKRNGDILVLNVKHSLKQEIGAELARAFPTFPEKSTDKKKEGNDSKEKGKEGEDQKAPASEDKAKPVADAENNPKAPIDPEKVYDKLSAVVIEEINKDHLLIRGRKDVLYKKSKRTIEVQALVSRRDILDDDTVDSANIIESNVNVLR